MRTSSRILDIDEVGVQRGDQVVVFRLSLLFLPPSLGITIFSIKRIRFGAEKGGERLPSQFVALPVPDLSSLAIS